jgi:hypothetical protein
MENEQSKNFYKNAKKSAITDFAKFVILGTGAIQASLGVKLAYEVSQKPELFNENLINIPNLFHVAGIAIVGLYLYEKITHRNNQTDNPPAKKMKM